MNKWTDGLMDGDNWMYSIIVIVSETEGCTLH